MSIKGVIADRVKLLFALVGLISLVGCLCAIALILKEPLIEK